jgi:hypothetical protein
MEVDEDESILGLRNRGARKIHGGWIALGGERDGSIPTNVLKVPFLLGRMETV